MSRMPKLLFFVLFFVGSVVATHLNSQGYFGPRPESGPFPVFLGFAFALIVSYVTYRLLLMSRWVANYFGSSKRYETR